MCPFQGRVRKAALAVVVVGLTVQASAAEPPPFDLDTGNAPVEVVIPRAIPAIYRSVSPTAGDAPLVLRITTLITNGWFDAIAPYHPTAVGVYSNLGRRPEEQHTTRNKNVAILHASFHVLNSVLPQHAPEWRDMLASVGLDPDDTQQHAENAVGIGNLAGMTVVAFRENDGMNQLGNEGDRKYNRQPYADYTGYRPVNTAYELKDPSRWQPRMITTGSGIFRIQQFVTPQLRFTMPYSYNNPNRFQAPSPLKSIWTRSPKAQQDYKAQADEVLAASAALTDEQKMTSELFDDKLRSLGFVALFLLQTKPLSLDEFVHYDFLVNLAAFDTAIAIWNQKQRWDAVRPFSAIQYLYGDDVVTAWGGPGRGTVDDITGNEWKEYLDVADHPEYPSASASFCAAHAEASRRFFGTDALGWQVPAPQGSSRIEPGLTPATDVLLTFETWTEFERDCGLSRLWGGVHFYDSIPAGQDIGHEIGALAYEFVMDHILREAD